VARVPAWGRWLAELCWVTDMAVPEREALGLTQHTTPCDRMEFRYRVLSPSRAVWWPVWARANLEPAMRRRLESQGASRPAHWWVSEEPLWVVRA
jgi:hypothetical protein